MSEVAEQLQGSLSKMENFQKLLELKKDLIGVENLVVPGRVSLNLKKNGLANIIIIYRLYSMSLINDTCFFVFYFLRSLSG